MDLVIVRTENAREILFETISVYFADTFWTSIYKLSVGQFKDKKYETILDAYKDNAERYSRAFSNEESANERINQHYIDIVIHLTSYFCKTVAEINKSKPKNISEKDFADIFTMHVFPEEDYNSMGRYDEHKSVAMRKILTKSVSIFAMYFITQVANMACVESNRKEPNEKNIFKQIKNKFKEIIVNERNDMYNFIVASRSGIDLSKPQIETIPKLIEERMTNEIKNLIIENTELIQQNNKNVELIYELKKVIKSLQKRVKSLEAGLDRAIAVSQAIAIKPTKPTNKKKQPDPVPVATASRSASSEEAAVPEAAKKLEKLSFSGEDFIKPPDELETASSSNTEDFGAPESDE